MATTDQPKIWKLHLVFAEVMRFSRLEHWVIGMSINLHNVVSLSWADFHAVGLAKGYFASE